MTAAASVGIAAIEAARARIASTVHRTRTEVSPTLSESCLLYTSDAADDL